MPLFARRRIPDRFQDPEIDRLLEDLGRETLPGGVSGNILRRYQNQIGRQERDALNTVRRSASGNPLLVIEGIDKINRGTAQAYGDAALDANAQEEQAISRARSQRGNILSRREDMINQFRMMEEEARYQNAAGLEDSLFELGGLGATIFSGVSRGRMLERLLRELGD